MAKTKKPAVKVKDLRAKKNPRGGAAIKFTTTTKNKIETLAAGRSTLKTPSAASLADELKIKF